MCLHWDLWVWSHLQTVVVDTEIGNTMANWTVTHWVVHKTRHRQWMVQWWVSINTLDILQWTAHWQYEVSRTIWWQCNSRQLNRTVKRQTWVPNVGMDSVCVCFMSCTSRPMTTATAAIDKSIDSFPIDDTKGEPRLFVSYFRPHLSPTSLHSIGELSRRTTTTNN